MQIPKQPRTRSTAGENSPEDNPAGSQGNAPLTAEDLNKQLQQAYSTYIKDVNSSHAQAQFEQAKAYLAYLEAVQQQATKPGADLALEYWGEMLQAHGDTQAVANAHKKYAMASVDQQASYHKTLSDAALAYSQVTRGVWEKLQSELGRHNQEMADALKDALLKLDVGTLQIPALSLLYHGLRSMSGLPAASPDKTG